MLFSIPPAGAQTTVDYDTDDDRLIEIDTPAKLNAIRHDLDGDGSSSNGDYALAFPTPASGQCPGGCQGYELTADLDLSTDYPTWTPIIGAAGYAATFDGNGHTISGLTVDRPADAGLFAQLEANAVIREVGFINPAITIDGGSGAGALVGWVNFGARIYSSYVQGGSVTVAAANIAGGGLVGHNSGGAIRASYSTAAVTTDGSQAGADVGGLVGYSASSWIYASYAAGAVSGSGAGVNIGGLVGVSDANAGPDIIADSYCDTTAAMQNACIGANINGSAAAAPGYATGQLQAPTGYGGIYRDWNLDFDGDGSGDRPWDFGSPRHYPLLKADKNGDGRAACREFSGQRCYIEPAPPPYNPAADHPEIYANARYGITASCAVETTGEGDAAVTTATLTFDLAEYTRPITLALSLWERTHFRSLQSLGLNMPELQRDGQTATVEVVTDPAQTRFRLDGPYGLNLVLGYADCHTDDP